MDDCEYEDYLFERGWFEYTPIRTCYPRRGHIGERVYFEEWQHLMRELPQDGYHVPNSMLVDILWKHPSYVTQRHASICTSVVIWLGTACGQGIRLSANRLVEKFHEYPGRAWLTAWTTQNTRSPGINHGYRTIEHLLAPDDHFGRYITSLCGETLKKRPKLTVDDYECVEHLMEWLGENGQGFVLKCERRIEELTHWERVQRTQAQAPVQASR